MNFTSDTREQIPVVPRYGLLSCQTALDLLENVRTLLMRGLCPRRNILATLAGPLTGGAIAEREYILVARSPSSENHELIDAIQFETIQSSEHLGRPHTGSPHY